MQKPVKWRSSYSSLRSTSFASEDDHRRLTSLTSITRLQPIRYFYTHIPSFKVKKKQPLLVIKYIKQLLCCETIYKHLKIFWELYLKVASVDVEWSRPSSRRRYKLMKIMAIISTALCLFVQFCDSNLNTLWSYYYEVQPGWFICEHWLFC